MIRYYSVPKETFVTNGTIVEPLNVTENGTYAPPAGTAYSPVVVNVEGGGGSSDFSTAEVTLVGSAVIEGAFVAQGTETEYPDEMTYGANDYALLGLNSLTLILYKGSAFITVKGKGNIEASGNIQAFAQTSDSFIVTGDCTITIS